MVISIACLSCASLAGIAIAKSTVSLKAFFTSLIFSKSKIKWGYPSLKKILECYGVHLSSIFEVHIFPEIWSTCSVSRPVLGVLQHFRFLPLARLPRQYHHSTSNTGIQFVFGSYDLQNRLYSSFLSYLYFRRKRNSINVLLHDVTE
ncbi:hypothetical protein M9H77_28543 [Catharanthus roseus]|uniref:Uncharacterized protein n=1 Tax=Catharanthus roseus TaxID=4058 RepID=A0ACC0AHL0_CATRO|nr:hypothetical protein M9H77_28543 [Catharanthus roseus]